VEHASGKAMYDKLNLLALAKKQMDWAARRQEVLANNVANADTPLYKPKDVAPFDFKKALSETTSASRPMVTNPMHVGFVPMAQDQEVAVLEQPFERSPDGNAVNLEQQMQMIGETRSSYETTTTLLSKNIKLLRMALGRGGGG
jgi:flagellar basal-body rod protein FlgB